MTTETTERSYRTIDKSGWPDGPWTDEPDKIQYTDPATGLPCLIKRSPHSGSLCGYVGVPADHPAYERHYDDVDVNVHGGLTYSAHCQEGPEELTICHIPEPGQPDDAWWLGFDTAHGGDYTPGFAGLLSSIGRGLMSSYGTEGHYRDVAYVRAENARLADQLMAMWHTEALS